MENLKLSKNELEAVVYQTFDSIATLGGVNCRPLTIGVKKLLHQAYPYYADRCEFLENFLNGYLITGDKKKDWFMFVKYIK